MCRCCIITSWFIPTELQLNAVWPFIKSFISRIIVWWHIYWLPDLKITVSIYYCRHMYFNTESYFHWNDNSAAITFSLCFFSVLETKTETLGPGFNSFMISNLLYGRTYIFTIRPLYGEVEGPISTIYQRICKTWLTVNGLISSLKYPRTSIWHATICLLIEQDILNMDLYCSTHMLIMNIL